MALKQKVGSLDELNEELHDLYEEKDGEYFLKPPEGFVREDDIEGDAENVKGLKSALQKEREANKRIQKQLKSFEDKLANVDLEEYEKLREQQLEQEELDAQRKGEWEKLKAQMAEKHQKALDEQKAEAQKLRDRVQELTVDNAVQEAIIKGKGNPRLLKPLVSQHAQLDPDTLELVVVEPDGTPKVDGSGNPATLDDVISEMRDNPEFSGAFAATTQSGSGSDPQTGGDASGNNSGGTPSKWEGKRRSEMSDREKVDAQKELGIDKYLEIPD